MVDAGFSDHYMLLTDITVQRPKPDLLHYVFIDMRQVVPAEFAARLRQTEVFLAPADDVDDFNDQLERSVTGVLDILAPLKSRTKRRGKRNSRWLSSAAVDAKRTRRQLERRWKATTKEADRVAYRAACRIANAEINASRAAFYNRRLSEADGDQRALWRVAKELLHDDRPPDSGPTEAKRLCDDFVNFFNEKLKKIVDDIRGRCSWHLPTTDS